MRKTAFTKKRHSVKKSSPTSFAKSWWLIAGSTVLVLLTIMALPLFDENETQNSNTPVGVIAQYPQQFTGNSVEVTGEITDRIGYRAFTIQGQGLIDDEVLVVSEVPLEAVGGSGDNYQLFQDNKPVRISGKVDTFNLAQVEDQIGFDLNDEDFAEWNGKPVIITNSIKNIN